MTVYTRDSRNSLRRGKYTHYGGAGSYNGLKGRIWYTKDSEGKVITSQGLFIQGLSASEKQNFKFTDNSWAVKTYPYYPEIQVTVGSSAVADTNSKYHMFYRDGSGSNDYNTANAVIVNDASGDPITGTVSSLVSGGKLIFDYDFDGNNQAGLTAGTPKDVRFIVAGDGIAEEIFVDFTITRTAIIAVTCAPALDANY